jgi:CheY-like chemotaxis protein
MERREWKRVSLQKHVLINDAVRAQALNLCEGGMYVHTSHFFRVGQLLKVSFSVGEGRLQAKAVVQHCREGVGAGLSFVDLSSEELELIREFVESEGAKTGAAADGEKKRVLLVEDNALSRKVNNSRLVLSGYTVFEAADGVEALGVLGAEKIDLVVLDLQIPKIDGYKVLSAVRENTAWKDIPVLVCSARTSPEEVKKAMTLGATEFLVKITTTPAKLAERVKARLK